MHYWLCTQVCTFSSILCRFIHIDFVTLFTFGILMKLTNLQRAMAVGQLNAGRSFNDVAQTFGVSSLTIRRLLSRFNQTNDVKDRPQSGPPRATSRREDNFICTSALRSRFKTATEINSALQHAAQPGQQRVSNQTVRQRLHEHGIWSRRPVVKQKLTQAHKVARMRWSRAHQNWRLAQWRNVLFSDEVRICLHHVDGRRRVWRRPGEEHHEQCVQQKIAYGGGSIMLWGGMSDRGRTQLVRINGNLNAQRYIAEILTPHVQPFAQQVGQNFILQQDNARAHTARAVTQHLTQNGITVMEWPACSPDLNPIEHLWDQLKQRIDRQVQNNTTLAQVEQIAIQQWHAIPMHRIRRLIRSMTTRVRECVQSNGAYTHY